MTTDATPTGLKPAPNWHAMPLDEVFSSCESSDQGLTQTEARERLEKHGKNELPQQPPPTVAEILLRQFKSPLIYILLAAAVVAVAVGDVKDAAFIAAVLVINALIGGYQEWRAEQSSRALQKLLQIKAMVEREGEIQEIDALDVVPGDVIVLESGNRVPADLRLISTHGLDVDESFLTGESLAVQKDPTWHGDASMPVADRKNMAYAGSIIVRGRGRGIVIATGSETAVGQLAADVFGTAGGVPPLVERMERFARTVAIAVMGAVVVVSLIGIIVHNYTVHQMFMFSVALAVSAIPEGLPAALTVALSVATTRMARRGVIVRRLAAVEGLGSCTMIGSDKTGTLTCNELTVRDVRLPDGEHLEVTGQGFTPEGEVTLDGKPVDVAGHPNVRALARAAVLCNEGKLYERDGTWISRGDPTDLGLLAFGLKAGWVRERALQEYPEVNQIPFEPDLRYSATFHRIDDGVRVFVKGATERVLSMCDLGGSDELFENLKEQSEAMAALGYRVLALAEGHAPADLDDTSEPPEPDGLTFLGFVGMIDPLRAGVREAVAACHDAGITVCMITGDHPITALAISRDLGLAESPDQVLSGRELETLSQDERQRAIRDIRVFARVSPRQKLELVEAAREAGHYVAVTGDGVNDAPALRTANIGVAMGKSGTDVAREAAELVISDDNFATIVAGVEEGRVAYDNVRKVIYLLISTGAAEVILVGLALTAGMPLPLLAVQLLWLNLVTNGIQGIALAFEPSEGDVLSRKPRSPQESIFNRLMVERTIVGATVMAIVAFIAFGWMIHHDYSESAARNVLLLLMVLFENVHIGNSRSETRSAFALSPLRSPYLLGGVLLALGVHVLAMYTPFGQSVLEVEPLDLRTWVVLIGLALTVLVAIEIHKITWRYRYGSRRSS